jgi:hypothetical protein
MNPMKKLVFFFLMVGMTALPLYSQAPATAAPDPWASLAFLQGTWEAKGQGATGAASYGTYTFRKELGGHILARRGETTECKGPADFDCGHGDMLYVFREMPGGPLKAIYFDNEGHVIHYDVTTPTSTSVEFLSEASRPGPQFRLVYELKGDVMSGRFQMHMPGQAEWKSYLEWSGAKK